MENETPQMPTQITFNYIKGNHFRVVHCDGAIGSHTPQGFIAVSFFSERFPIPQQITHKVDADGNLGDEMKECRVQSESAEREVEVELIMKSDVARNLAAWLNKYADAIELENQNEKVKP